MRTVIGAQVSAPSPTTNVASQTSIQTIPSPSQNALILSILPINGDYFSIGADKYEYRTSSPPTGGTAGNIWVHVDAAATGTTIATTAKAINGVVDPLLITRTAQDPNAGTNTELFSALGTSSDAQCTFFSTKTIGGGINDLRIPAAETDCSDFAFDHMFNYPIKDMTYGKNPAADLHIAFVDVEVNLNFFAPLEAVIWFPFTVGHVIIANQTRGAFTDTYRLVGQQIYLSLTGGVPPATQDGDVLTFMVFEATAFPT